jgi:hypothetical protein
VRRRRLPLWWRVAAAVVARMHDFIHEAVCSSLRVLQTLQTQARRLDS